MPVIELDKPDLVCQLNNVQGMVDALACVRCKCHQDALIELYEHGIVLIVEKSGCLQAKVYLQHELFTKYEYGAQGRPRFGISLGLLVDCLNTFSSPGHSNTIEIKYPGPDMELLLKSVDTLNSCIYSEIGTRIPQVSYRKLLALWMLTRRTVFVERGTIVGALTGEGNEEPEYDRIRAEETVQMKLAS